MYRKIKSLGLVLAFVLSLSGQSASGQSESQEKPVAAQEKPVKFFKGYLSPFPNNRGLKGCYPAEVTMVSQGGAPPEGLEVVMKNFHWKIINAVKIGWYIAEDENRTLVGRIIKIPCDGSPLPDKIVLSGQTSLINIAPLHPEQRAAIAKKPSKFNYEKWADKVVLLDSPLFTIDEVKELTTDGTFKTFKKIYLLILGLSEIHFADGSIWKAEGAPTPLTLSPN
jgi:hypothetical protein